MSFQQWDYVSQFIRVGAAIAITFVVAVVLMAVFWKIKRKSAVAGIIVFSLGFFAFMIDFLEFNPLSTAPFADFVLMGSFMACGLVTMFMGRYSGVGASGMLMLAWTIWTVVPSDMQTGDGDNLMRLWIPIIAVIFLVIGIVALKLTKKKRHH